MNSNTISEFKNRLENLKEIFEIDNKIKKIKNLDLVSSDENFWNDQEKAQKILKKQGELKSLVNSFTKLNDEFDDLVVMYDFFECKEISENEMINYLSKFEKSIKYFEPTIVEVSSVQDKILDDEISNKMPLNIIEGAKNNFSERLHNINWDNYYNELPFNPSALSLYKWAPIAEELKTLDRKIVLNSVILKWDTVKKEFQERINF